MAGMPCYQSTRICQRTTRRLTLALSGRPQALQARGRRKEIRLPDARPHGPRPRPLERVVSDRFVGSHKQIDFDTETDTLLQYLPVE